MAAAGQSPIHSQGEPIPVTGSSSSVQGPLARQGVAQVFNANGPNPAGNAAQGSPKLATAQQPTTTHTQAKLPVDTTQEASTGKPLSTERLTELAGVLSSIQPTGKQWFKAIITFILIFGGAIVGGSFVPGFGAVLGAGLSAYPAYCAAQGRLSTKDAERDAIEASIIIMSNPNAKITAETLDAAKRKIKTATKDEIKPVTEDEIKRVKKALTERRTLKNVHALVNELSKQVAGNPSRFRALEALKTKIDTHLNPLDPANPKLKSGVHAFSKDSAASLAQIVRDSKDLAETIFSDKQYLHAQFITNINHAVAECFALHNMSVE